MDQYPDRIPGLARRLEIDASKFSKSVEGFENFTNQAIRVTKDGISKDVCGGKMYYLETNAKEGVLVVTRDGKYNP